MMLQRSRLYALCSLVGVAVVTAQGCAFAGDHVSGRVVDIDTGKPVSGAYVYARSGYYECGPFELGGCGCVNVDAQTTRTDNNGRYTFNRPFKFGSYFSDRFGTVAVYKEAYISAEDNSKLSQYAGNFSDLYHQYFFGTGRYANYYKKYPLNVKSSTYRLTQNVPDKVEREINEQPKKIRLYYLRNVLTGFGGPACIKNENRNIRDVQARFAEPMCREAQALFADTDIATVSHDELLLNLQSICER